jgi:hypothetical protein
MLEWIAGAFDLRELGVLLGAHLLEAPAELGLGHRLHDHHRVATFEMLVKLGEQDPSGACLSPTKPSVKQPKYDPIDEARKTASCQSCLVA